MKYLLGAAVVLLLFGFFFVHTYTSSPGLTMPEMNAQFEATKMSCRGWSFLLNAEEAAADAPGKSLCIGLLESPKSPPPVPAH